MSKQRKRIFVLTGILALTFGMMTNVSAMHIMEGYLPGGFCIAWGALCIPFLVAGFLSIKKTLAEHKNLITLLAMSGAFVFVISSLKLFSHDRNRTGRYFIRTFRRFYFRADCSVVSGYFTGPRRTDYHRSKYFFHGNRRSVCILRNFCVM